MKKILLFLVVVFTAVNSFATTYTYVSGAPTTASNWKNGGTGATNFTTNGDIFIVPVGVSTTATSGTFNFGNSSTSQTVLLQVDGTLNLGASGGIIIGGASKILITNGGIVNGTSGPIVINTSSGTFQIDNGGTYNHGVTTALSGAFAGTEVFGATSNINVTAAASITNGAVVSSPGLGNFTYSSSGTMQCNAAFPDLQGNLTVNPTTAGTLRLNGNVAGRTAINIGGNLTVSNLGTLDWGNGTVVGVTINLAGDLILTATGTTATTTPLVFVGGGGVSGTPVSANLNFTKTGTQNFTSTNTTMATAASGSFRQFNFAVNSGSILDFGTNVLQTAATTTLNFTVASGGGLITKNTGGITAANTASGCVQNLTGTRTFNTGADYTYNGTAAQVLGTGFTGARNLTISNTSGAAPGVAMNTSFSLSGNFTLTTGDIRNTSGSAKTITMTGAAPTLAVGGAITGTNVGVGNDLNLVYTNTSGTLLINGAGSLCRFLNVTNTNTGSTIALARTLEVMFGTFTENGYLQINSGGAVSTAVSAVAPTYGASSTLVYNSGTSYGVNGEWTGSGGSAGLGIPKDIIVQNNTTVTTTAARGLAGTLLVSSGSTFVAGGGTLAVTGSALIDGSFQLNSGGFATGTFAYAATNSKLIFNTPYTVAGGHTYFPASNGPAKVFVNSGTSTVDFGSITRTIPDSFSVSATISNYCNLTLNGVTALNSGYNFSGSCGSGPFYACNSTLNYNSGGTPSRGGEWGTGATPGNISISNSTTFNGNSGTATICGNLNIAAGSSLYMDFGSSGNSALNVGGNVSIAGNLSLGFGVGGDMTVGGNWTHTTGTFNSNNRAVAFTAATGDQTITNAAGETFPYLTINKAAGNVVLGGDVTVTTSLNLTSGNLSIASSTLTLNGAISRTSGNLAGGNSASLVIGSNIGSLYFDAAGTNNYLKNFTINASSSATLANALNITGGASANSEGALIVTGSGVLTTGGFLTIKSNINGSGRIAANTSGGTYISGNVTVERYIRQNSSKGWRLLGTNTTGQTINAAWQEGQANAMSNPNPGFGTKIAAGNIITTNLATAQALGFDTLSLGISLFKYNPNTDALETVPNTNATSLASQQGYYLFIRGDRSPGQFGGGAPTTSTTLRSTGTLFLGNQSPVSTGSSNWGLVRNPYPSRIDMRQIVRTPGTGTLNDAYQVWDAKIGGAFGVGGFQTFSKSGADYIVTPGGGSYGSNGSVHNFLESGTAFFIQSTGGTASAQVVEIAKEDTSSNASFRPTAGGAKLTYNVYANNSGNMDMVDGGLVFFDNAFSNSVDVDDVRKSTNFNENFGIVRSNVDLAIERRQLLSAEDTIFFKINQMRTIAYRLDVAITDVDPLITTGVLEDKYTGSNTALNLDGSTNNYAFSIDNNAASKAADRFRIVFKQSTVVPVSFISIRAAQAGSNIAVEWKVANQVNVNRYEVEKSTNGRNFSNVGTINAGMGTTYNWLDENAVSGNNFYRIRSVDNNGHVKYTEVVKVFIGKGGAAITVSPNPVQNGFINLQFNNQQAGTYAVRLINIAGQVVYNRTVQHGGGSASQSFALPSALVSGVYQLEVTAPDSSKQVQKLIVNTGN